MYALFRPMRFLARAMVDESTPRQLALGFALGVVIGLVPKGNLLAFGLMTFVCCLRVNLGMIAVSAFAFSWVGVVTDGYAHRLGLALLEADSLQAMWTQLYNTPAVPWTDFNNTIVLGSLVLGLVLIYPVFRLSLPVLEKTVPKMQARVKKYRVTKVLFGAEWADRIGGA